ncbi:MAG TPA: hypothetical protein VJH75_00915 [Patescibacteria group bacterium]|nr:hypothetical protein [Patescibacteria group bacterium]
MPPEIKPNLDPKSYIDHDDYYLPEVERGRPRKQWKIRRSEMSVERERV